MTAAATLPDIPDMSAIASEESAPFADGWYKGTILERREFTDSNGNDRVFESTDDVSQRGDSRNIRLQAQITRKDGRTLNTAVMVNYAPDYLTAETITAVKEQQETMRETGDKQWGTLFRPFMTLKRLGALQRIAGVRGFSMNGNGGLDLSPLYNKSAYFKLGPDDRNPQYKAVKDFREDAPKGVTVF
jgi:hypothetical protein